MVAWNERAVVRAHFSCVVPKHTLVASMPPGIHRSIQRPCHTAGNGCTTPLAEGASLARPPETKVGIALFEILHIAFNFYVYVKLQYTTYVVFGRTASFFFMCSHSKICQRALPYLYISYVCVRLLTLPAAFFVRSVEDRFCLLPQGPLLGRNPVYNEWAVKHLQLHNFHQHCVSNHQQCRQTVPYYRRSSSHSLNRLLVRHLKVRHHSRCDGPSSGRIFVLLEKLC